MSVSMARVLITGNDERKGYKKDDRNTCRVQTSHADSDVVDLYFLF